MAHAWRRLRFYFGGWGGNGSPGWAVTIGLAMFGWFCWKSYWPFVPSAFTDHLFALLVFVTILATVRAVTSWSWTAWLIVGLTAAAGAATRPSLMTYPIVLAAFIVLGWTEKQRWLRIRAALILACRFLSACVLHDSQLHREWQPGATGQLVDSDPVFSLRSQ